MPTVNPQITDAVTETNAPGSGAEPPSALDTIDQSLALSTGFLLSAALEAQLAQNRTAQASLAKGVALIYAPAPRSEGSAAEQVADEVDAAAAQLPAASAEIGARLVQAVRQSLDGAAAHSSDVAYAARAAADAFAASVREVDDTNYEGALRILQVAGIAACVAGIARSPSDAGAYAAAIETIRKLV